MLSRIASLSRYLTWRPYAAHHHNSSKAREDHLPRTSTLEITKSFALDGANVLENAKGKRTYYQTSLLVLKRFHGSDTQYKQS